MVSCPSTGYTHPTRPLRHDLGNGYASFHASGAEQCTETEAARCALCWTLAHRQIRLRRVCWHGRAQAARRQASANAV
jgi:hypothetical protein